MSSAAGIDVGGVRKGCDLVVLDGRQVVEHRAGLCPDELPAALEKHRADAVAIDAPPAYARNGAMRSCERELVRRGIRLFVTPCESRAESAWYGWMRVGFACFDAVAPAFPAYRGGAFHGHSFEVFPHATTVVLDGTLPPRATPKAAHRRELLERHGVDTSLLRTIDAIDAALCALTGVIALAGDACTVGDADEGLLVLPTRELRDRYEITVVSV